MTLRLLTTFSLVSACALVAQTPLQYTIATIAGTGTSGFTADGGAAASAGLAGPFGVSVDGSGNLYIADQNNNRIRKVAGGNITTLAGTGTSSYSGDGKSATAATLSAPAWAVVDGSGNIFVSDSGNSVIRKVSASGTISTIAGVQSLSPGYSGDTGAATSAVLARPAAVVLDRSGNLYIADSGNNAVRMVTAAGVITTVAGTGTAGFSGDGGAAVNARLRTPIGLALDRAGNLYIGDSGNNRVRMISGGTITTVAGTGVSGKLGDGGPAVQAQLSNPKGVAFDAAGNLYIADSFNNRVRVVGTNGMIATIAGNGSSGYGGDGGPAVAASLFQPAGVAVNSAGVIFVADTQNNVVRSLTPATGLPAITAGGVTTAAAFGGQSSVAPGTWIEIYGTQLAQSSRGWGGGDFNGSSAPTSLDGVSVTVGGQAAYVDYISAGQVNAQLPTNLGTGSLPLTVTTALGTSAPYMVTVNPVQPGIFSPASFQVGGTPYAGALFSDGVTYAVPAGAVAGVASRPAKAGDVVTFYGVGFGAVSPAVAAGQIVQQQNRLAMPFGVTIGGVSCTVNYAGLAPGAVGLYQFNVVVPAAGAGNAVPVVFTLGGAAVPQTLFVAIGS